MQEPLLPTPTPQYGLFNITFTCIADTPLTRCQVGEYDESGQRYPPVDLSRGAGSAAANQMRHLGNWIDVRYNGTGLEDGQCGAEFSKVYLMKQMFGCRGMDAAGEWHQMEFAPLYAKKTDHMVASINPRETVVQPGSNVSILLTSDGGVSLPMCTVMAPFDPLSLVVSYLGMPTPCRDHYCSTHGRGMANGECGITLLNVTEADNGPLVILALFAGANHNQAAQGVSKVIVASPPNATYFKVDKPKYSTGEKLRATCSSVQSRPVANLTWTLDDRIIRQDARNDHQDEESERSPSVQSRLVANLTSILNDRITRQDARNEHQDEESERSPSVQSRPAANLTRILIDMIIQQIARNEHQDEESEWSWSWDKQTITQSISLELGEEHFGKKLECSIQHMAMCDEQVKKNYVITKE